MRGCRSTLRGAPPRMLTGPMSEPLTQLEQQVYHFMIDFLAENTYQPSVREIARKFSIKSTKTVSDLLHALEDKGYITRDESRSRGVRLLGYAATGAIQPTAFYTSIGPAAPWLRDENRKAFITIDRRFLPGPDVCWLKAAGGGMTSRAILDDDYLMISPSMSQKDGDIVAVRVGNETIVKVLSRRGATTVLQSADDGAHTVDVGPDDNVSIIGVVC